MNQACVMLGMTMPEALTASTINAAAAIAVADEVGSIEVGKRGDLLLLSTSSWEHVVYLGMGGATQVTPTGRDLDGRVTHQVGRLVQEVFVKGDSQVQDGLVVRRTSHGTVAPVLNREDPWGASGVAGTAVSSKHTFLAEGLPAMDSAAWPAPALVPLCPSVPHAPKRPVNPSTEDQRLALRNALRYF